MTDHYRRDEVARVLKGGASEGVFRLKVTGQVESRWLNVSGDELRKLAYFLDSRDNDSEEEGVR